MKIHLTPRHLRLTDAIEKQTVQKLAALTDINNRVVAAHVTIGQDPAANPESRFTVSARLSVAGPDLHAEVHSANLYAALDAVASKLARQLRKRKTRLTDHRRSRAQRAAELDRREAPVGL
jgi:putative sigma-54 modulation protein